MLGYYHPKNGGKMQIKSKIWFDQTSDWYKSILVPSGIQRIKDWFMVHEIPNNPDGKYKLGDNLSITVNFDERVIIKDNESEKTDDRLQAWSKAIIQEVNS